MRSSASATLAIAAWLRWNFRRRFDRLAGGDKLHMPSLCALAHFDLNQAGPVSTSRCRLTIRQLQLLRAALDERLRLSFPEK